MSRRSYAYQDVMFIIKISPFLFIFIYLLAYLINCVDTTTIKVNTVLGKFDKACDAVIYDCYR